MCKKLISKNIYKYLRENEDEFKNVNYKIPKIWTLRGEELNTDEEIGEIEVNPYEFYANVLEEIFTKYDKGLDYYKPISENSNILSDSNIYAMHVRATMAWFHEGKESFESDKFSIKGSFLKSIALIPKLKDMGINIIYLLPIFKTGNKYTKGDAGSPYAVKDYFTLNEDLKEKLLGNNFTVEDEFKAFVEIAHMHGMKVILDFIPRSVSRDNNMIMDHPDWFYWIDIKYNDDYSSPKVLNLGVEAATKENLNIIYDDKNVKNHIKKFTFSPDVIDPVKWKKIKDAHAKNRNMDFLSEIEKEYGITTAPGFSDQVNDSQPQWMDVTFLKLYKDFPLESKKYVKEDIPPYVLFDIIKADKFSGNVPNKELWDIVSSIATFYSNNYGIDGTRIDMGHALPKEFENRIIKKAKKVNKDFIFLAEDFNINNGEKLKDSGYNVMLSSYFAIEAENDSYNVNKYINDGSDKDLLGVASSELPDTPRIVSKLGKDKRAMMFAAMNNFIPNTIPMINTGMEIMELQPMNIGLGSVEGDELVLDKNDPMYGKLAFFDNYVLHWTNKNNNHLHKVIRDAYKIRNEYKEVFSNKASYVKIDKEKVTRYATHILYKVNEEEYLYIVANDNDVKIDVENEFETVYDLKLKDFKIEILFSLNKEDKTINNLHKFDLKVFKLLKN